MGFANFDKAGLSVIAYALINADGTLRGGSNLVPAAHTPGSGNYVLLAPNDLQGNQIPMFSGDDMSLATIFDDGAGGPGMITVSNLGVFAKAVNIQQPVGPPVDRAFSILILRQLVNAPTP
jgi:hypothetical protein